MVVPILSRTTYQVNYFSCNNFVKVLLAYVVMFYTCLYALCSIHVPSIANMRVIEKIVCEAARERDRERGEIR